MASNAVAQQSGTAVTTRPTSELGLFQAELEKRGKNLKMALPSHISLDKFQRTLITAVAQNPDLLRADRNSLFLACYKAAHSGLLPDGRESALVIFRNRKKIDGQWMSVDEVAFIEMVYGVRKKILQARDANGQPIVSALYTGVVYRREYEEKHFYYDIGVEPPLGHRPMIELTMEDAADANIIGAYSIATMADGTKSYKFLRRFEIDKIRETSKTGATRNRDGTPREAKGPWVDWFPGMSEKTALKQHAKSLPQSGDLIIDVDDDDSVAGMSAAALLSVQSAEPQLITDDSGDTIDSETGEIIEDDANVTSNDTSAERVSENAEPEQEQTPARGRGRQRQPEPEKAAEPSAAEPVAQERTLASEIGLDDQPATDDLGVTEHPASKKAYEILAKFAAAETVIDLERHFKADEGDIAAMPDDIYETVMGGYNRHRVRLGASRISVQQAEPAK